MSKKSIFQQLYKSLHYILLVTVVASGVALTSASADNGNVPVDLQVKLILTALTYDKNLETRANGQLNIGILYFPESSQSKKKANQFAKTLEGFKDKKISGRSFSGTLLSYSGNGGLRKKIIDNSIDVLYIVHGKKELIDKVLKVTQAEKIISCTCEAELVSTCGVTMAVGLKNNKPKIYLNLASAKSEGADFSAKFLRVAEIVDGESK